MNLEAPRFIDSDPLLIAGLDRRYTFQTMGEIPGQWETFGPYFGSIPGQVGKVAYGLCHEMDAAGFRYMSGVEVADASNLPEGFEAERLPARRYAVFPHREHISRLCDTIDAIWRTWLPESGCQVVEAPAMLERYGEEFDPAVGAGDVEVWLPLKT